MRTVKTLAKHIQESLKKTQSCTIFEGELERGWPSEKIKRLEREKNILAFAKAYGLTANIRDPGIRVIFKKAPE
jgi:hypothetical protein